MRLAVVAARYPFGNAEPYLGVELSALAREFEGVSVVPLRRGTSRRAAPHGVNVLDLPPFSARCFALAAEAIVTRPAQVYAALATLARSRSPFVTKLKNVAVVFNALAIGAWARRHRIDHIHAYWLSTPATAAFVAARIAGIPWSSTAHRWDIYENNALDVKGREARFIRAISRRGQRDVRARLPDSLAGRVRHVPMGVVVPPNVALASARPLRLLCPAALVAIKGHETLLQALAILRARGAEVRCDIAGSGPLRSSLELRAAELALDDVVTFLGFVAQDDLHARLERGDYGAVILSSNHGEGGLMEGVPAALIEAMARGVAVVATDSGSVGELVDASTGALVPPSDPLALANAVAALADDRGTQARATRAYERVRSRHDLRRQAGVLASLMNDPRMVPERTHS